MKTPLSFLVVILVLASCMQRDRGERRSREKSSRNVSETPAATSERTSINRHSPEVVAKKIVTGKAVRIIDGDTFVLLLDNDFETGVRLNAIDCPEKKQAFSERAKKELSNLIFGRELTVYYDKKDGFGRVLGDAFVDRVNVNHEMLRKGMAWHYVKYSDDETLSKLEKAARENKVGLWAEPNPVPPWEYRSK